MSARSLLVGALVLACPALVHADDGDGPYVPPDFMSATPPLPEGIDAANVWRLDLTEALRIAIHQNLGLVVERQNVGIADLGLTVAGGPFEPQVTAFANHSSAVEPPVTSVDGVVGDLFSAQTDSFGLTLSQTLETGTVLQASMASVRANSTLGTAVAPLDYTAQASVSISQPLLRGFSLDRTIPRIGILTAHIASETERYRLALQATTVIEQTEDAYWDVVQALYRHNLDIQAEGRAKDQAALTERQIAAGTLAPGDLIGVQSTVAQHHVTSLQSAQAIDAAWDKLRGILNLPHDQWTRPILPTDVPRFETGATTDEQQLAIAIANRPELAQADLSLESGALSIRVADNNKLPAVSVGLSAQTLGENAAFGSTIDQTAKLGAHTWGAMVTLAWTPLRRAASAQATIARRQYDQLSLSREQLVQQVWLDVRDAVRTLHSTELQVFAAAASRKLAEQTLEIEQRRFLNSQSTNINVAAKQAELAGAQVAELGAVLDHRKAQAALLRATGRLLAERNIDLGAAPAKK